MDEYREHRFDWNDEKVEYYLDGKFMHGDTRTPNLGGNLQLKLWADGNMWWSGQPSKSPVTMSVQSIVAYFNVTSEDDSCEDAGGPNEETVCEERLPR